MLHAISLYASGRSIAVQFNLSPLDHGSVLYIASSQVASISSWHLQVERQETIDIIGLLPQAIQVSNLRVERIESRARPCSTSHQLEALTLLFIYSLFIDVSSMHQRHRRVGHFRTDS